MNRARRWKREHSVWKAWSNWTPLEKATFVAQIAVPLALLVTVVFGYLSWREARLARDDQAQYFVAEKAPQVRLAHFALQNGLLIFELSNEGDSPARQVLVDVDAYELVGINVPGKIPVFKVAPNKIRLTRPWPSRYTFDHYSLPKKEKRETLIATQEELVAKLGFLPSELVVRNLKVPLSTDPGATQRTGVLFVRVSYRDVLDRPYSETLTILAHAAPSLPPPVPERASPQKARK